MPYRRQPRHAVKPTAAKGNLFGLLPPELRKEIIDKVRKDRLGNETVPAMYLLGERYVGAMENLAGSSNAKVVVLPADLQETVRGLMGRNKA